MLCSNCGRNNDEKTRFCTGCGTMLIHSQQTPKVSQPETLRGLSSQAKTDAADALTGRTFDGKYRLDSRLGIGGMGAVYLATRLHIGDTVAVKVLHAEHGTDPQSAERFRREAQAAARLKHPNVVSIYDFGIAPDGLMYIVMELVEGRSLREIIKLQGPLAPTIVAEAIQQVCSALDEAHGRGIIHRDIKPDNIILHSTNTGLRVKVLDFGIAKLRDLTASNLTQTGSVMGTPHYMSPEQCMGEELDNRSDIYSLGIVMYEMLCGTVPFNSPTSTAVVVQQVTQEPPSMRAINASITPKVEAVVRHALDKKREARPQTAAELAREMSAAVSQTVAVQPGGINLGNTMPATTPSGRISSPEMTPTIALSTPASGNRSAMPANSPSYQSGGASSTTKGRNLLLLIAGGIALLVIAGGAISIAILMGEPANNNNHANQNNNAPVTEDHTPRAKPSAASQSTPANSADDEYRTLSARGASATLQQKPGVLTDLKKAEDNYSEDYRFPYERAKLLVGRPPHREAFGVLSLAAQRSIDFGKDKEMLNKLTSDSEKGAVFFPMSDHLEFGILIDALTKHNKDLLKKIAPSQ